MTKKTSGVNKTATRIMATALLLSLLFFPCLAPKAIGAAEQDKPIAAEPPEEDSVRDLIEELYVHYEAIDKRLRELKAGLNAEGDILGLLTQTTIYVKKEKGFKIVSVELKDNGATLWNHLYTTDENNAMDSGGRHQIFKGDLKKGDHRIFAAYRYSTDPDSAFQTGEISWQFKAGDEPVIMDIFFVKKDGSINAVPRKLFTIDGKEYVEPR
ncbi:MAG TPA: hypothetical protein VFF54_04415 [Thermodesulfobacteriota bacterium]|nr:hypothetical protein [Thermodesulfobacteriota bacterium]